MNKKPFCSNLRAAFLLCTSGVLLLSFGCTDILYALTAFEEAFIPISDSTPAYIYPAFEERGYLIDWVWYYGPSGLVH